MREPGCYKLLRVVPAKKSVAKARASVVPQGYNAFLSRLKARIRAAQLRSALAVNRQLLGLYWEMGRDVVARQEREGWGSGIIERLAKDLQAAFPGVEGFSTRNLWRMRAVYFAYRNDATAPPQATGEAALEDLPQTVADLPGDTTSSSWRS
jgi:hypothetical protein